MPVAEVSISPPRRSRAGRRRSIMRAGQVSPAGYATDRAAILKCRHMKS